MVLETFWRRRGGPRSRFPPLQAEIKLVAMKISDIKQLGSDVKALTAQARATGPKTEAGKLKSALNATRHGLAGKNLLLPGEDPVEYEARMDELFATLAPRDEGEAQLVALAADDIWKLSRLAKIEKGVSLARIEELLALTGSGERAGIVTNAIQVMGNALNTWSAQPLPSEKGDEFMRRLRTLTGAVDLVASTVPEVPRDLLDAVDDLTCAIYGTKGDTVLDMNLYNNVYTVTGKLMAKLLEHGDKVDAQQDELRTSIATIALPDEAELKKLARYRSMLELSLGRRLAALEQMRKITAGNVVGEKDVERAKEYRVKLRVVA